MKINKKHKGESFESLIKRFRKSVEKSDILNEVKAREQYIKPSTTKKLSREIAKKREKKRRDEQSLKTSATVMHSYFDGKYYTEIYTVPIDECMFWAEFMDYKEDFYKMILKSVKEKGIVNPLMGMKQGGIVKVRIGNTRLKVAKELGIPEVPMILLAYAEEWKKYFDEYSVVPVG